MTTKATFLAVCSLSVTCTPLDGKAEVRKGAQGKQIYRLLSFAACCCAVVCPCSQVARRKGPDGKLLSMGYGFVETDSEAAAKTAIKQLQVGWGWGWSGRWGGG